MFLKEIYSWRNGEMEFCIKNFVGKTISMTCNKTIPKANLCTERKGADLYTHAT